MSLPLSVSSLPMAIVVVPLTTPVLDDEHELARRVVVNAPPFALVMFATFAVVVTEPVGPSVPCVLTSSCPVVRNVAGPTVAVADGRVADCGVPVAGSVTVGAGPRWLGGPPKRPTVREYP